jgi:hypothetical protein
MAALIVSVTAGVAAAVYLVSLQVHPWRACRACGGRGKTGDRIWRAAHGTCPSCGGKGRHPRLALRILAPARYRRLAAERPSHKAIDQRRGRP